MAQDRYEQRGVSSSKEDVHAAISGLDQGVFPGAFCKILPDTLGGDSDWCVVQHADGAGTKAGLAYLAWKLSGDLGVWQGIAQDSIVMNSDDMGCVGATGPFLVSNTIDRNKVRIPSEVVTALIQGNEDVLELLRRHGIACHSAGGETADVGDLSRTIIVNSTLMTRMRRDSVIDASRINAPALIIGFSSTGQAIWEDAPNSGIGSNGLTNARHDVLSSEYRVHTETYAPETSPDLIYSGKFKLTDSLPGDDRFTIGSALLSPTRTYLPLIAYLVEKMGRDKFLGFVHCSGGGQTKIGKFGQPGIVYVKDNLFATPPLFTVLQEACGLPWREMYQTYNMGHRLEAVVRSETVAKRCIEIARGCGIDARIVGRVEKDSGNPSGRTVVIQHNDTEFTY